jgi:hypothetical protein
MVLTWSGKRGPGTQMSAVSVLMVCKFFGRQTDWVQHRRNWMRVWVFKDGRFLRGVGEFLVVQQGTQAGAIIGQSQRHSLLAER